MNLMIWNEPEIINTAADLVIPVEMAVAFLASALKQPNGSPLTQITNLRYAVNEAIPPIANPCGF